MLDYSKIDQEDFLEMMRFFEVGGSEVNRVCAVA